MRTSKQMLFEGELRKRLQAYLHGTGNLQEFSDWLFSECWDHRPQPGSLAASVESILSEHSSGFGAEDDVKRMLSGLLTPSAR